MLQAATAFSEQGAHNEIIRLGIKAQKSGANGVFVWCFTDPAVDILREVIDVPVVGAFAPAVLTANAIAQRYAIVTALLSVIPIYIKLSRELGVSSNIVSIREIGMPVLEMDDKALLLKNLVEQSIEAIKEGAQAIVLGCTGMLGVAKELQRKLAELKKPAPVVDPTEAALVMLQGLIRQKITQSRLAYCPAGTKCHV